MIINHYLADKNTTETFKISGSYKFDSWIKHYTIKVVISLHNGFIFPIDKETVTGKFSYKIDEQEYIETVLITNDINTTGTVEFIIYEGTDRPVKINTAYAALEIDIDTDLDNYLNVFGYTSILETAMEHTSGIKTNVDYIFTEATIGKYYQVEYTVSGDAQYGVYVMVGTSKGQLVTKPGTYIDYLKMTDINKISFFASGFVIISDLSIKEYVVLADALDFSDKDGFINYSWSMSYSLDAQTWTSFHSYIPDTYLTTNSYMYSLMNDELSVEYTIRDEDNNYITGSENEIIIYYSYTYS